MSDAKDKSKEESSESEPEGPLGGERLAEARRTQKIAVLDIAKELHLDEPKVRALERNEFETLGAPVFAKGHLRKYAHLVQVDEGDVMADYYQLTRAAGMPPLVSARPRPRREMSPGPWIAVIVVFIVVASAYWW
jgi:cytoskeleton protein RodZ